MSLNRFESECSDYLERREREFLRRSTKEGMGTPKCNLSTNSYLRMECDNEVNAEALKLSYNRLSGSTASRLVYSEKDLYPSLEKELSDLKGSEASLLFNSGYTANTGILQATASRKSEVFSDRLNHASIIDGIKLSQAKSRRYRHCDTNHLESLLKKSKADKRII
ncbi:MAG: aminotransferase class I/II-fold pyridoxal phosphate-dependent enzyme, partial [Chitinivibrionales bacterium]